MAPSPYIRGGQHAWALTLTGAPALSFNVLGLGIGAAGHPSARIGLLLELSLENMNLSRPGLTSNSAIV